MCNCEELNVKVNCLEGGRLPEYKTEGAGCMDCYASNDFEILVPVGGSMCVPLGFRIEIPSGYKGIISNRSGLTKKNIQVQKGVIDSDYRGEVCCTVYNASTSPFTVNKGDRICQFDIERAIKINFEKADILSETERGTGGFGSTGI